jgi:hypothetical protein
MRTIERDAWSLDEEWMAGGARVAGITEDGVVVRIAGRYQFEEWADGSVVARVFGSRVERRWYTRMTLGV